ncbi:MAG: hypothetical protein CMI59_02070 [Parvibaculum sp.]|nr:hypothetical protein [Parvibaculum sp.]
MKLASSYAALRPIGNVRAADVSKRVRGHPPVYGVSIGLPAGCRFIWAPTFRRPGHSRTRYIRASEWEPSLFERFFQGEN